MHAVVIVVSVATDYQMVARTIVCRSSARVAHPKLSQLHFTSWIRMNCALGHLCPPQGAMPGGIRARPLARARSLGAARPRGDRDNAIRGTRALKAVRGRLRTALRAVSGSAARGSRGAGCSSQRLEGVASDLALSRKGVSLRTTMVATCHQS